MALKTGDVSRERVLTLVQEVFGLESLDDVTEIVVEPGVICVRYNARDDQGNLYMGQDGEISAHIINRRLV